mgnify:CR=1 FL=1
MEPEIFPFKQELDTKIKPLPKKWKHEFIWSVSGANFLYVVHITDTVVVSRGAARIRHIRGSISVKKYEQEALRWYDPRRLFGKKTDWVKEWSIKSHYENLTIPSAGYCLVNKAVEQGIVPTELLIDKIVDPINRKFSKELQRLQKGIFNNDKYAKQKTS